MPLVHRCSRRAGPLQAGATEAEIAETTFVAMAMAAGAAWSHGGLALQCAEAHAKPAG
jgi:alkylhydroperoxidase/carboxymuconolactone decarboxylase family protein YurZ